MRAITGEEKELFSALTEGECGNFVLLSTELDGIETAVIAAVNYEDGNEGDAMITPVAVLVNDAIMAKLTAP